MTKKLPAMQFYPGDWRKDVGVQSLTFHDRGVWFEILMLMHESERRGVLILNGKPITDDTLSRILGLDKQNLTTTLTELLTTGVASREPETGALMCRRMVRDEETRQTRKESGKLGGNPILLNHVVNQKSTTRDKQKTTPSSSSSVSPSVSTATDEILPEMVARAVLVDLRLSGDRLHMTLCDIARQEADSGKALDSLKDQLVAAWTEYDAAAPKLAFHCKPQSFFGDGKWRNKATWGWKQGMEPTPSRRYVNA